MKTSKFKKGTLAFLLILVCATLVFAGPTEDRDDHKWTGDHEFTGTVTGVTATNAHTGIVTITKITTGTNAVQDALTMDISGADTTTGFGAAVVWKLEDDTGTTTEEHGRIDVVITTPTSTTEDSDMVFKQMVNGDVTETFRLVAAESATAGDYFQFISNTTELNAEITTGIYKLTSVGTEAAGLGATHEYWMVDAGGGEIQAEFATVFTTITDSAEDVDLVWRHNDNGTVSESMRLVADADGTVEGTRLEITSRSAETNGVNDLLVLKASGGTTVAGFGVGIDMQAEFADGVETAGKIEAVWTDVSTGTEDADIVFSAKDAGATVELARFDSDGNLLLEGATADGIQTIIASEATTADKTFTLPDATGTAALTDGIGSFRTVESLTATNVQTSADCGKTLLLTHATVAIVVTLPAPSGLSGCEFWVRHNLATNQDHTVVTNASANLIRGSIMDNDGSQGSYQAAGDVITFVNSAESIGDFIHLITDGTSWFVDGGGELNGAITQGST